jgi:nitrile hydratase subunit beta
MIGGRHMDEVGLLAAIVPLRQRPSRLIACCRKWAAFSWQRAISSVEENFDEDESRFWEACMSERGIVLAVGEEAVFHPGDRIRVSSRSPIGHYRVPAYLRGKAGTVETVIEPTGIDNEQEGYGRNAGKKLHYYRIAVPLVEIWPDYAGSSRDGLRIEVFETWLEGI